MVNNTVEVLTIGHSTQTGASFVQLLRQAGVTAVGDVRSVPFSRHVPQFNREALQKTLADEKIAYVYLGDELGGRPKARELYSDGVADYEKMAQTESFARGIDRVMEGARTYRIALMCSESDPLDCHRCLLIGRALKERGVSVRHILGPDETIGQEDVEQLLLAMARQSHEDLFTTREDQVARAYRDKARRAAFSERPAGAVRNDQFQA